MSSSTMRGSAAPRSTRSTGGHSAGSHGAQSHPSGSRSSGQQHSSVQAQQSGPARPAGRRRQNSRPQGHAQQSTVRPPARTFWDTLPVSVVPTENLPSFAELGLPTTLVKGLARSGITTPFPIQAATIPDVLSGRDLLGRAATGSGKTMAFGLPLIARLAGSSPQPRRPHALVLVPTRELAMQVTDAMSPLASACGLSVRLVAGGLPLGKQVQSLERGVDILVATPGRLEDLIARRACDLGSVQIAVLDEADHMADLGFLPVVRRLLDLTPNDGQRLLFSATLDGDVAVVVQRYLSDPAVHALATVEASVDTMSHHVVNVDHEAKFDIAASIVAREGRTLGFVRTKHGADRLARNLGRVGIAAGVLHGGRSQPQRNKALEAFRDGSVPVLIATDVAARGIHVDDVSLVVHIDPPADPKDYLHRSGRTARAGESGVVVLLSTPAERRDVQKMLTAAGVNPESHNAGDVAVAQVTGARAPSGIPIAKPQQSRPTPRADGSAPHPSRRSGGGNRRRTGDSSASHSPQNGEQRPRRNRRPR